MVSASENLDCVMKLSENHIILKWGDLYLPLPVITAANP